jgi:hypothetical protein
MIGIIGVHHKDTSHKVTKVNWSVFPLCLRDLVVDLNEVAITGSLHHRPSGCADAVPATSGCPGPFG